MSTSRSAFHETHCKAPIFVLKALKASAGTESQEVVLKEA